MVNKRRVITARAQRANTQISTAVRLFPVFRFSTQQNLCLPPLPYRDVLFRVGSVPRYSVHKFFQGMRAFHFQKTAPVSISIDIDRSVLPQFFRVILSPLRGAEQHGFFAVPRAIDDGAFRLPSLFQQLRQAARLFEQCNLS